VSEIGLYRRNRRFFRGGCNELRERLELNRENRDESVPSCKFGKGGLADTVDSTSAGSEAVPKKVCSFARNADIGFPVSRRGGDVT